MRGAGVQPRPISSPPGTGSADRGSTKTIPRTAPCPKVEPMPQDRTHGFQNLGELEAVAGASVPPEIWDYIQGGAGEERTLRANRTAFERRSLYPRVLQDVASIDPTTTILGQRVSVPFFVCPMAYQAAVHPDGETGTAMACSAARVLAI